MNAGELELHGRYPAQENPIDIANAPVEKDPSMATPATATMHRYFLAITITASIGRQLHRH